jgi:hypothetical protein
LAGIVDEELLPGSVLLAKTGVELLSPLVVEAAELTILVTVRIALLVLIPKELECHPLLLELLVQILHGRHLALIGRDRGLGRKETIFQGDFIQIRGKGPTPSGLLSSVKIVMNRATTNPQALSDLSGGEILFVVKTQNFFNFTHG